MLKNTFFPLNISKTLPLSLVNSRIASEPEFLGFNA
jgi:hypothetical protein